MAKKDSRFIEVLAEGNGVLEPRKAVFVDRETGVNYLWYHDGYAGGLTVLVDSDGKPVVTKDLDIAEK